MTLMAQPFSKPYFLYLKMEIILHRPYDRFFIILSETSPQNGKMDYDGIKATWQPPSGGLPETPGSSTLLEALSGTGNLYVCLFKLTQVSAN